MGRRLPRGTELDAITARNIREIAMTRDLTPRKCPGYRSPVEAVLSELGRDVETRFA
jgi:IS30 family transposase